MTHMQQLPVEEIANRILKIRNQSDTPRDKERRAMEHKMSKAREIEIIKENKAIDNELTI